MTEFSLSGVPVFAGMTPERQEWIARCARMAHFERDDMLFEVGQRADTFHVIVSGAVALEIAVPAGPPVIIETLHAGDVVGWSWLVPPYTWHLDGRADEATETLAFDAVCLRGKADADPVLGYDLMRRFAPIIVDRLQHTRLRLLDVYGRAGA